MPVGRGLGTYLANKNMVTCDQAFFFSWDRRRVKGQGKKKLQGRRA